MHQFMVSVRRMYLNDLCAVTGATLINEDLGDDMDIIQSRIPRNLY